MKTKNFFLLAISLVVFAFVSCGSDSDDDGGDGGGTTVTGITLTETMSVAVLESKQLVATLLPAGATGTITWSSSNQSIATVNNGIVTGIKQGTVNIAASCGSFVATCEVTVTPQQSTSNHASLKGSDYYVMVLDATSTTAIEGKIKQDYRPDDVNKFLYVWGETLDGLATTGLNFYGEAEGWTSFVVKNPDWSGAGFAITEAFGGVDMRDITNNVNDYYFHVALKSDQPGTTFTFVLYDGGNVEAKLIIGTQADEDGTQPYMDIKRNNEWQEIEVPMTYFQEKGLYYRQVVKDQNVAAFLAGGGAGKKINIDAMFIYKKAK